MFVSLLITAVVLLLGYVVWGHCDLLWRMRNVPGPKQYFLIGSALEILVSPVELFKLGRIFARKFPGIYKFIILKLVFINIYNPEDIEAIISTTKSNNKGFVYSFLKPWLGDGLLISSGHKWQERRKMLTPTFHFNILSQFCSMLGEITERLVNSIEPMLDTSIDVTPIVTEFTLTSTCETAMGTSLQEDDPRWKKYKEAIYQLAYLLYRRFCEPQFYFDFVYRMSPLWYKQQKALIDLHAFTSKVIHDRKEHLRSRNVDLKQTNIRRNKHTPMLDLLIAAEDNGLIDEAGIQEEVDTFMFEGHDTTSSGLTFCLMVLANNPNAQEKIFQELDDIFGDSTRPASMEDLSNMRYLECCIKESLRLYPPVHFINRIVGEDVILSGHKVRAGTICNIHIFDLHRREDLFPNPEKFDPDRFLPENCIGRHPYAYIPFSAGPRNCIGQRFAMMMLKSALSGLLRRFKLLPVTTPEDIQPTADIVLRNSGPVTVTFTARK